MCQKTLAACVFFPLNIRKRRRKKKMTQVSSSHLSGSSGLLRFKINKNCYTATSCPLPWEPALEMWSVDRRIIRV